VTDLHRRIQRGDRSMPRFKSRLVADHAAALRSTPPHPPGPGGRPKDDGPRPRRGAGEIALPDEDPEEIEGRFAAFEEDLRPRGEVGRFLVKRAAMLSVRLDRCARHESAMTSKRVREAEAKHDDERMAYVEKMGDWIAAEPATHVRRLKTMPEGIDWLIKAWQDVKADLTHPTRDVWNYGHRQRVDNLMGRTPEQIPWSPLSPLCKAGWGDFSELTPDQGGDLAGPERKAWAREELGRRIDAEVAALEALRSTLDDAAIATDRAEAGRRALFDASRESILARKYEAAAERGLFRTLRELQAIEGDMAGAGEPAHGRGSLASSRRIVDDETGITVENTPNIGRWGQVRGGASVGADAPAPEGHRQR
jgi:hypothetical protein